MCCVLNAVIYSMAQIEENKDNQPEGEVSSACRMTCTDILNTDTFICLCAFGAAAVGIMAMPVSISQTRH